MSKTDQTESDFDSIEPQPVTCEFRADCEEPAQHALDVAVADEDTKEIPVCSYHAERVCDFSIGFSGSDVRDLRPQERYEDQLVTDGGRPLKYLRNDELRAEIAYAVGGDPSHYEDGSSGLVKADLVRVADAVCPAPDEPHDALSVRALYDRLDAHIDGMEHEHNAGCSWGIARDDLKAIHRAVDAGPYQAVATDGGRPEGDWYPCAACGAAYRNRGAALACCTDAMTGAAYIREDSS